MGETRGPQAVRAALVEAAADLFARQGDASVRAVANHAGVNHGLVHHYLGGKQGLRTAVLERLSQELDRNLDLPPGTPLRELAFAALRLTDRDPRFIKLLARTLLDDDELPKQLQKRFPVVARLREATPVEPARARAGIAQALAVSLGAAVFEPWIRAAVGMSEAEFIAARDAALERIFAELEEPK
jgi:AcrR family transcriptional regulator